jgi:hypothetical protein
MKCYLGEDCRIIRPVRKTSDKYAANEMASAMENDSEEHRREMSRRNLSLRKLSAYRAKTAESAKWAAAALSWWQQPEK